MTIGVKITVTRFTTQFMIFSSRTHPEKFFFLGCTESAVPKHDTPSDHCYMTSAWLIVSVIIINSSTAHAH